jgi:hypothetical protein
MDALLRIWNPPDWPAIEAAGTWVAAIGTLAAVFLALRLAQRDVSSRRIERRGEVTAMIAEVFGARSRIQALLTDRIQAPLYRLPIANFNRALPKLIGDGQLSWNEIDALVEYANRIEEVNRGLDRAGDAHAAQPMGGDWLKQEFGRNQSKAWEILEEESRRFSNRSIIEATESALFRLDGIYAALWDKVTSWWERQ